MIEYANCTPDDIRSIEVQPEQEIDKRHLSPEIAGHGFSYAGRIDGTLVAVGGVVCKWPGTGKVWSLISPRIGPRGLLCLTRFTKDLLAMQPYRRLEASVVYDFAPGHRWIRTFGFAVETERAVGYDPEGRDCTLYSIVRSV